MKKNVTKIICAIFVMCLFAIMELGCISSSGDFSKLESKSLNAQSQFMLNSKGSSKIRKKYAEKQTEKGNLSYTISDEVIVDDENCTFKIVKAEENKIWGFTLKVFCENKTSDKALMFSIDNVSVNGYMVDPFWAKEVAAGKKSNDEISFSSSSFKEIGIATADEIIFTLNIYDSDDWWADSFVKDTFRIYPTGLTADAVTYPERISTSTEQVVIDNDQVCFVILESGIDNIWGYSLHCYLENKTDKTLMFSWDDVSVNGFLIDPFWATEVAPGIRSYSDISFSKSEFEKNDIDSVEEIEYSMRVYDSDDWFGDDIFGDTLTYKP